MPIYEYKCGACGHQMEAFQKIKEAPLTECPECHQGNLNKLVSAAGFQLKGKGWYVTDYRDKSKNKSDSTGETSSDGSGSEVKTSPAKVDDSKAGGSAINSAAEK